tara:strand:- start:221 stop:784 length:564 start_codon:yes stop_codon:yes gene_type:complete
MASGTQRLDSITDSAWFIVGALTLTVFADRILDTATMLAKKNGVNVDTAAVQLAYALIMTVVGISSITLALSDEWCRSIVSALSVGLGFALREVVAETLVGLHMSAVLDNDEFELAPKDFSGLNPTVSGADKPAQLQKWKLAHRSLLSCKLKRVGDEESNKEYLMPWTRMHACTIVQESKDEPSKKL